MDDRDLDFLFDFLNSRWADSGDDFESPERLSRWLAAHGYSTGAATLSDDDARNARHVRAAVRDLLDTSDTDGPEPRSLELLQRVSERSPIRFSVGPGRALILEPAAGGLDAAYARVLAVVYVAGVQGILERLKVCKGCRYAFVDRSKNRSRVWCEMSSCGAQHKVRAYRERKRDAIRRLHGDGAS